MKKKIFAIALAAVMVAAVAIGSFAYFTDKDDATNTFTVGSVDIELIESQLHRTNAGRTVAGRLSTGDFTMEGAAGTAPDDAHNWRGAYFTDDQIKADAETYQNEYLAEKGQNLVPGQAAMKCPYVINTGKSDAYVRVRVLVPKTLDDGILSSSMYTSSAIISGAATMQVTEGKVVDGVEYNEYAFTYTDVLAPEAMTFWNVWGDIKLNESATMEQINALIANGDLTTDGSFGVLVQADAIQATGFADAAAAFAAFDAQ